MSEINVPNVRPGSDTLDEKLLPKTSNHPVRKSQNHFVGFCRNICFFHTCLRKYEECRSTTLVGTEFRDASRNVVIVKLDRTSQRFRKNPIWFSFSTQPHIKSMLLMFVSFGESKKENGTRNKKQENK
jgi:hypothetical protein